LSFFLFFVYTWVWTHGLMLPRQILYYLRHASSPFWFWYSSERVSHFYHGSALPQDLPISPPA
jgi:hypothetical protein